MATKIKNVFCIAMLIAQTLIAGAAVGAESETVKLVLAHGMAPAAPLADLFEYVIKDRLERYSEGAIQADVHGNNTLCSEHKCIEQVTLGQIDIGAASSGNMGSFGPIFDNNVLPYLFKDDASASTALNGWYGDHLIQRARDELGLHVLAIVPSFGYRQLENSVRPVKVPSDLKGIKLRVTKSPVEFTLLKEWGATPIPYSWGQIYEGLSSGVVKGMYVAIGYVAARKLYEVVPYVTITGGPIQTHVIAMQAKKYDSLPTRTREVVDKVFAEVKDEALAIDRLWVSKARKVMAANAEIYYPTEDELKLWMKAVPKAWLKIKGRYDVEMTTRLLKEQGRQDFIDLLKREGAL